MSRKRIAELEQRLAQMENLAASRLTLIALLVQRNGGRVNVGRADLASFQGWTLRSLDDGDDMTLLVYPPTADVPAPTGIDEAFGAVKQAVKRALKH